MEINRRNFFEHAGLGLAAFGLGAFSPAYAFTKDNINKPYNAEGQQLFIGKDIAIVQTMYGKVKGFVLRNIFTFRGIPYGDDTSGENRFMPPKEPKPWEDVRPAVFYGNSAPQDIYDRSPESYSAFVDHWNYDELGEDCLRLNVWTPSLERKKRPVLVWLHGGGFARGNGIEQDGYNGENISRAGDIVFCSINHRLGPFGFSDFSGVDQKKFGNSGNVGMLDIVAALKWINENIENFGGDPDNVTVMGQSGGGAKVCNIAAMPAAKGLVHKGIALSGSAVEGGNQEYTRKLGEYILEEAGLGKHEVHKLQEIPWNEYYDLAYRASEKIKEKGLNMNRGGFGPIADGINIPKGNYFKTGKNEQPDIPLIFCTTFHEWNPNRDNPGLENISLIEVAEKIADRYGEKSIDIVNAYANLFPEATPMEIWALVVSNRQTVVHAANQKLKQQSSVYMAWFGWESPLFDHRHRAFHCIDISFWLLNTDKMITHTGGGQRPLQLSMRMAQSLINFMYKGSPNCENLPAWAEYTSEQGETMVLNDKCELKNDPDRAARAHLG
ncbi:carboxylesterase/lipase family protein [Zunongwangia profunda]|uniref:carboxylesterase/lipase family protein n=1 Tax=Zunongwangia profunda TaxID=398743 RepID=UPI001D190E7F|nr:carboxylesterase family protein [Zunongwangia profunda]MCC4226807.1 carboxylesterase family protein [Zunongwangia profunda]